ncbi:MAG: hypothetical protein IGS03_17225 [Candidatus Sericytochromatia bacterium]|nr:hypothetical protein [Candidatus Sericytochromatia bacterium]
MTALTGIQNIQVLQQNAQALAGSAQRLSRPDPMRDLIAERVLQLNVQRSTAAQVKVLQTADEMLGTLIDLRA